jgi:hypothetical protein
MSGRLAALPDDLSGMVNINLLRLRQTITNGAKLNSQISICTDTRLAMLQGLGAAMFASHHARHTSCTYKTHKCITQARAIRCDSICINAQMFPSLQ